MDDIKKPQYYRTISVKGQDMEKAILELDRQSNLYIDTHTVLHSNYTLVYGFQIWVASRSFCCESQNGERY